MIARPDSAGERPLAGVAMLLGAMACFSVADVLAKHLSERLPAVEIAWIRYLGLALAMLPSLLAGRGAWRSTQPPVQIARAVALVASSVFYILGLHALPMAEATALVFASPLFITLLSALWLGERVDRVRWIIAGVGFCGVLVVMRPGTAAFQPGALWPIASSIAWAVAVILTRRLSASDRVTTTMLHSAAIGLAILSVIVVPDFAFPALRDLLPAATMAVAWCVAQWLTLAAYHRGTASTLAPFAFSQLLWSSLLGYIVFGHVPDAASQIGIAIIVGCGILAAWRARAPGVPAINGPARPARAGSAAFQCASENSHGATRTGRR